MAEVRRVAIVLEPDLPYDGVLGRISRVPVSGH